MAGRFLWFGRKEHTAAPPASPEKTEAVRRAMRDAQNYALSHGGRIKLLEVSEDGVVTVAMQGACKHCPLSGLTIKLAVERRIQEAVPGIVKVVVRDA